MTVKKDFAEISIGSDDGLAIGHKLRVISDKMVSGLVIVRRVDPDRSVVELLEKEDILNVGDRIVPTTSKPK